MDIVIKASQFLLSISILIVLHEFGHFLPAKLFKTRVEKFYLFFNPKFSLFKRQIGETEYGLGWIPLGGYVKIAGMIDESMDTEQMKKPPQPWEFRSKPTWQRLIIMLGGVIVNLIVGFVVFAMVFWVWGQDTIHPQNAIYGVQCDSLMHQIGMQDMDTPYKLDGVAYDNIDALRIDMILEDKSTLTVLRNGIEVDLALPNDFGQMMIDSGVKVPWDLRFPAVIGKLLEGDNADKADLAVGDSLIGINGVETNIHQDIARIIRSNAGQQITLDLVRDGQRMTKTVDVSEEGTIGFYSGSNLNEYFDITHKEFSFGEAIPAGWNHARQTIRRYVISMKFLFSKSGITQIGGFGAIADQFPGVWDWQTFWERTAWLSLVLAVMNILPIPALDGGHVLFLLYEMVSGRPPGQKFMERAQTFGIIFLLALILFANGNDIFRAIFK